MTIEAGIITIVGFIGLFLQWFGITSMTKLMKGKELKLQQKVAIAELAIFFGAGMTGFLCGFLWNFL